MAAMKSDFIFGGLFLIGMGAYAVRTRRLPIGPARWFHTDAWAPITGRFAVAVGACWIVLGGALVVIGLTR